MEWLRRRIDLETLVFFVLLCVLAADLSRVAFVESHWDEDAAVVIGWLLAKGWRLYSDVFSHHMPLDYFPAWAIASIFGNRFAVFRAFMVALWAGVCSALFVIVRRQRSEGLRLAPFIFAALSSQWLTYWMGEMMLVESYWGYAAMLLLVMIDGPIESTHRPVSPVRSASVGVLMGILVGASPTCFLAFVCFSMWLAVDSRWRKAWKSLLAGFAAWSALYLLWAASHADLGLLYLHVIWFNANVYARFSGLSTNNAFAGFVLKAAKDTASYFLASPYGSPLERYFEGLLKLAVAGWIGGLLVRRRYLESVWWIFLVVSLKARAERVYYAVPFHSTPFFLVAVLLLSCELALMWRWVRSKDSSWLAVAAAAACALILAPTLAVTSVATASLRPYSGPGARYQMMLAAVRQCTRPSDRIAVFPVDPRFYFDSDRLPATPSVFYLPWQAAWPAQRLATREGLERYAPKILVVDDVKIWDVAWSSYGADINDWARDRYVPVIKDLHPEDGSGVQMLVRKQDAAQFVQCATKATAL